MSATAFTETGYAVCLHTLRRKLKSVSKLFGNVISLRAFVNKKTCFSSCPSRTWQKKYDFRLRWNHFRVSPKILTYGSVIFSFAGLAAASRFIFSDKMFSSAIQTKLFLFYIYHSCSTVRKVFTVNTQMTFFTKRTNIYQRKFCFLLYTCVLLLYCNFLILRTYVEECCSVVVLYILERVGACVTDL